MKPKPNRRIESKRTRLGETLCHQDVSEAMPRAPGAAVSPGLVPLRSDSESAERFGGQKSKTAVRSIADKRPRTPRPRAPRLYLGTRRCEIVGPYDPASGRRMIATTTKVRTP